MTLFLPGGQATAPISAPPINRCSSNVSHRQWSSGTLGTAAPSSPDICYLILSVGNGILFQRRADTLTQWTDTLPACLHWGRLGFRKSFELSLCFLLSLGSSTREEKAERMPTFFASLIRNHAECTGLLDVRKCQTGSLGRSSVFCLFRPSNFIHILMRTERKKEESYMAWKNMRRADYISCFFASLFSHVRLLAGIYLAHFYTIHTGGEVHMALHKSTYEHVL